MYSNRGWKFYWWEKEATQTMHDTFGMNLIYKSWKKLAADATAEVEAEGCMYSTPYDDEFFGVMESEVQKLNMQDPEDANAQLRRGGAKTRDGQDSVCGKISFSSKILGKHINGEVSFPIYVKIPV